MKANRNRAALQKGTLSGGGAERRRLSPEGKRLDRGQS